MKDETRLKLYDLLVLQKIDIQKFISLTDGSCVSSLEYNKLDYTLTLVDEDPLDAFNKLQYIFQQFCTTEDLLVTLVNAMRRRAYTMLDLVKREAFLPNKDN